MYVPRSIVSAAPRILECRPAATPAARSNQTWPAPNRASRCGRRPNRQTELSGVQSLAHLLEQQPGAILILHIGAMYDHGQDQPQGIDCQMSFATSHLFAGIVATNAANFRGFYALAVENRGAGFGLSPLCTTQSLAEFVVNLLPQAPELPLPEQIVNRSPLGKVARQLAPLTACAVHIQNGIDHLPPANSARPADTAGRRQQRFDQLPLLVGQIAGIISPIHGCGSICVFEAQQEDGAVPFSQISRKSSISKHALRHNYPDGTGAVESADKLNCLGSGAESI